ncbi:hypothetical protein NPX13_g4044 [Xylaria arbuscula]|uniref:DUF6536 domain-containing protein n=1 Tax=Xylaria arbuscula TaxID=114810 RepID=A0A9W8NGS0_9PEZI|nr:hypothetical protein NPX13_g4044 [Xylaria arbuscula]
MPLWRTLPQNGWRRAAVINIIMILAVNLALLIFFVIIIYQPGASISRPTIFFKGDCTTSSNLNLLLHLAINIFSTAVLASSNFFMQILSSPSRTEINQAHEWLRPLDIGIPSTKNLFYVSRFKRLGWLVFFVTSLPIHLFFNSAIFETSYRGSQWHFTIATEAFTRGVPFFPPGSSLSPGGTMLAGLLDGSETSFPLSGYGDQTPLDQYWNATSTVRLSLSRAADQARFWVRLKSEECQSEYRLCSPRKKYGDMVLIVDTGTDDPTGWKRSQIYSGQSAFWDARVPWDSINPLWYSTQCQTTRQSPRSGSPSGSCRNTCLEALGFQDTSFDLYSSEMPSIETPWLITFFQNYYQLEATNYGLKLKDGNYTFAVQYCLAEPIQPECKVQVSNALLLVIIVAIFLKIILGIIVVWILSSLSLVTPGDAIQSFITDPDRHTQFLGSLDITDSRRLELLLSFCYFSYNSLITMFHVEKEWNSFRHTLRPLRVSYPVGQQVSTYRLQLPYKASIPLIGTSIIFHWLLSNALFFIIIEGGYWNNKWAIHGLEDLFSVAEGSLVAIGYSPLFFLILFILSLTLVILPLTLLGFYKQRGDMVAGGWNSLVLSAACHVPTVVNEEHGSGSGSQGIHEHESSTSDSISADEDNADEDALLALTRREVRWGAMVLQVEIASVIPTEDGHTVLHLGLGGEDHNIGSPVEGEFYI